MSVAEFAPKSLASEPKRRRKRPRFLAWACLAVVAICVFLALFGSKLAPNAGMQDLLYGVQEPSGAHPLGTDDLGRDILQRIIVGTRDALLGPALVALGAMLIGNLLGLIAGTAPGWRDTVIMRSMDLIWSMPTMLLAIVIIGVIGGGYFVAVALLVVLTSPSDTRIVRNATLHEQTLPYVEAARVVGANAWRIRFFHIWPNIMPLVIANTFFAFAHSLVILSSLSFLGIGNRPGAPDWGLMLSENITLLAQNPLSAIAPGAAIVLVAISMNLLGDWVQERIAERGRA